MMTHFWPFLFKKFSCLRNIARRIFLKMSEGFIVVANTRNVQQVSFHTKCTYVIHLHDKSVQHEM
jgi:hypothetical protein